MKWRQTDKMLFKQPRLINPLKYLIWTISTGDSSASPLAISIAAGFVTLSIEGGIEGELVYDLYIASIGF